MATAGVARSALRATLSRAEASTASMACSSCRRLTPVASTSRTYMSSSSKDLLREATARPSRKLVQNSATLTSARRGAASAAQRRPSGPGGHNEDDTPEFNMRLTPPAAQDIESVQSWLRAAFPATPFPDDVALQFITHESWDHGIGAGHNRRLAFIGRRALKFYMSLFLAERAPGSMSNVKIDDLLQTSRLGDGPGRQLNLAEVMRWTPAINDGQMGPKETGLFKIRGVTVEALMGAIYHQHGASAARSFFRSRILPTMGTFDPAERENLSAAIEEEQQVGEAHLASMAAANGLLAERAEGMTVNPLSSEQSTKVEATVNANAADDFFTEETVAEPLSRQTTADSEQPPATSQTESSRLAARRRAATPTRRAKSSPAFNHDDTHHQAPLHLGTA